jgi:RNA polymerase sigma-70 factor (ECF subfamily)
MDVSTDLIEAARTGDSPAMDALISAVWADAFRISNGITRDRTIAEDAAQNACAVLCRSLAQLRDTDAFAGWFYRIVVREARSALTRERREPPTPSESPSSNDDDRIVIGAALDRLTPAQREAIVLHYYADLNSREIGRALGIPDATVRFRLMTAHRKLRAILSNSGATAADEVPANAG